MIIAQFLSIMYQGLISACGGFLARVVEEMRRIVAISEYKVLTAGRVLFLLTVPFQLLHLLTTLYGMVLVVEPRTHAAPSTTLHNYIVGIFMLQSNVSC